MENASRIYKQLILDGGASSGLTKDFSFKRTVLDASTDCIKVISVDGNLLTMNKAGCSALGVPEDSEFGMPWLPLLADSVQEAAQKAIDEARHGNSARFPGKSEIDDKIKYWDNLLTPLSNDEGRVQMILCVSRDVTIKTLLERDLENALAREKLLAQEMRHRIKNVFAVVSWLVSFSRREADARGSSASSIDILNEKLDAFARASDVIFMPAGIGTGETGHVEIDPIARAVMLPYADRSLVDGAECTIPRAAATAVVLFLHELATNSVKYGAFSVSEGFVRVSWDTDGDHLSLAWQESGGPPVLQPPSKKGFGSDMVDRVAQSAGGKVIRTWPTRGFAAQLRLPVPRE